MASMGFNDPLRDPLLIKRELFTACLGGKSWARYWSALKRFIAGKGRRGELEAAVNEGFGPTGPSLHNSFLLALLRQAKQKNCPVTIIDCLPISLLSLAQAPEDGFVSQMEEQFGYLSDIWHRYWDIESQDGDRCSSQFKAKVPKLEIEQKQNGECGEKEGGSTSTSPDELDNSNMDTTSITNKIETGPEKGERNNEKSEEETSKGKETEPKVMERNMSTSDSCNKAAVSSLNHPKGDDDDGSNKSSNASNRVRRNIGDSQASFSHWEDFCLPAASVIAMQLQDLCTVEQLEVSPGVVSLLAAAANQYSRRILKVCTDQGNGNSKGKDEETNCTTTALQPKHMAYALCNDPKLIRSFKRAAIEWERCSLAAAHYLII